MSALRFFAKGIKNRSKPLQLAPTWQREKDSNPHIRSQSPLCYLYTIPLNARAIIHAFRDLSRIILGYLIVFCRPFLSLGEIVAHQHIHAGPVAF